MLSRYVIWFCGLWWIPSLALGEPPVPLEPIQVTADGRGFETTRSKQKFCPVGFNYDHDREGRLIEDYWETDWPAIEQDFAEMRQLGAQVVRVHLQFGKFMKDARTADPQALARLTDLLALAERTGLYLDLTGLGCYHKADVPAWYDALNEEQRWAAQAAFWTAVARTSAASPAVFCYDLMNEPVVPGGRRNAGDWLGPAFAGKHFVQVITLDQQDRPRPEIARQWTGQMVAAIRAVDPQHLITIGLVDWSLDRPGLTSGFVPSIVGPELDFMAVHLYPESGKRRENLETLQGFRIGKPVVIEETFPLKCSAEELEAFLDEAQPDGLIGFYWGQTLEELTPPRTIGEGLTKNWLELFRRRAMNAVP